MTPTKPVVLCILDGWGLRTDPTGNAPLLAKTPNLDQIARTCPMAQLLTHGRDAGLPAGQMGNSEVGHTNIGAGRVVAMDLGQIDLAIEDGSYGDAEALQGFIKKLKSTGGAAHLLGVMSDGGVHGHLDHLIATLEVLHSSGVPSVVHAVTDGRDVAPSSALGYLADLEEKMPSTARIGTVIGRYYALDRDNRWERVETAYAAIADAKGAKTETAKGAILAAYEAGKTDEFVEASVIGDYSGLKQGDGIFCLNFRSDRAREILAAIGDPDFEGFQRTLPDLAARLGMVEYSDAHNGWFETVFPKRNIVNTLGEWVAKHGKTQFRLAETEKYPHVTFFLNGGIETPSKGEDRFMPKSPKVATYDLQPEMSSTEVTDAFVAAIEKGYDLIVTNYANPDMVGHTGDLDAAIAACEAVDTGLGRVLASLEKAGGAMIITADHGNCETMIDPETGGPHTAHTTNPVPVTIVGANDVTALRDGRLADLAPSLLELMGLPQPPEMTGKSLLVK